MTVSPALFENIHKKDFVLGAAGAAASIGGGYVALKGSEALLTSLGVKGSKSQTYFRYYDQIQAVSNALLRGALKALMIFYVIILVPIIEEWVFRDLIYEWQNDSQEIKIFRVLSNGILFGAFHVSVFHGWANVPIVAVSTIAGIVFAALREMRGNRYASTIAHSINNSFVLFISYLRA